MRGKEGGIGDKAGFVVGEWGEVKRHDRACGKAPFRAAGALTYSAENKVPSLSSQHRGSTCYIQKLCVPMHTCAERAWVPSLFTAKHWAEGGRRRQGTPWTLGTGPRSVGSVRDPACFLCPFTHPAPGRHGWAHAMQFSVSPSRERALLLEGAPSWTCLSPLLV